MATYSLGIRIQGGELLLAYGAHSKMKKLQHDIRTTGRTLMHDDRRVELNKKTAICDDDIQEVKVINLMSLQATHGWRIFPVITDDWLDPIIVNDLER